MASDGPAYASLATHDTVTFGLVTMRGEPQENQKQETARSKRTFQTVVTETEGV